MNDNVKEIVDSMYADFDWYGGLDKKESARFKKLLAELNREVK